MQRLRKFFRLPPAEQIFLLWVGLLLVAVRLGLSLLPFPTLRRWVDRCSRLADTRPPDELALYRVTTAVDRMSRSAPDRITCLTKALVTQMLLRRRGYPVDLRIGVAHGADGKLAAHAWVEYSGRVIIGLQDHMDRYVVLPSWDGRGA